MPILGREHHARVVPARKRQLRVSAKSDQAKQDATHLGCPRADEAKRQRRGGGFGYAASAGVAAVAHQEPGGDAAGGGQCQPAQGASTMLASMAKWMAISTSSRFSFMKMNGTPNARPAMVYARS